MCSIIGGLGALSCLSNWTHIGYLPFMSVHDDSLCVCGGLGAVSLSLAVHFPPTLVHEVCVLIVGVVRM